MSGAIAATVVKLTPDGESDSGFSPDLELDEQTLEELEVPKSLVSYGDETLIHNWLRQREME